MATKKATQKTDGHELATAQAGMNVITERIVRAEMHERLTMAWCSAMSVIPETVRSDLSNAELLALETAKGRFYKEMSQVLGEAYLRATYAEMVRAAGKNL